MQPEPLPALLLAKLCLPLEPLLLCLTECFPPLSLGGPLRLLVVHLVVHPPFLVGAPLLVEILERAGSLLRNVVPPDLRAGHKCRLLAINFHVALPLPIVPRHAKRLGTDRGEL